MDQWNQIIELIRLKATNNSYVGLKYRVLIFILLPHF